MSVHELVLNIRWPAAESGMAVFERHWCACRGITSS